VSYYGKNVVGVHRSRVRDAADSEEALVGEEALIQDAGLVQRTQCAKNASGSFRVGATGLQKCKHGVLSAASGVEDLVFIVFRSIIKFEAPIEEQLHERNHVASLGLLLAIGRVPDAWHPCVPLVPCGRKVCGLLLSALELGFLY
ncbi:hypothetical protein PC110_g13548, partial [Phytophthora cactorum]